LKNSTLGELSFAELNEEELQALKNAEDVINKISGRRVYLMALAKE